MMCTGQQLRKPVAIGLTLLALAVAPTSTLDFVRWGAFVAIVLFLGWRFLGSPSPNRGSDPEPAQVLAPLSAVLVVSVTAPINRAFDELERQLFKNTILQCARIGDQVSEMAPELYSIVMTNVSPEMAEGIGRKMIDQLQEVIVLDEVGAIAKVRVCVGGVAAFSGSVEDGQRAARENLGKVANMVGSNILMS